MLILSTMTTIHSWWNLKLCSLCWGDFLNNLAGFFKLWWGDFLNNVAGYGNREFNYDNDSKTTFETEDIEPDVVTNDSKTTLETDTCSSFCANCRTLLTLVVFHKRLEFNSKILFISRLVFGKGLFLGFRFRWSCLILTTIGFSSVFIFGVVSLLFF